ncbi:MAG TPA: hypothetical protein VLD18_16900, partial [Verrucomicrobiae bacterium]|nr:hypothetical protein [Verrucomicrobiae bacterium]
QREGAAPGAFRGLPDLRLDLLDGEDEQSLKATFTVPGSAPFYADHFPRRPVLPGTLLMNAKLQLAAALAAQLPAPATGGRWVLHEVTNMKLRAFTPPGETLEIQASLLDVLADSASVKVQTRNSGSRVGNARVHFVPEVRP